MSDNLTRFAAFPSAVVYNKPGTTATRNAVQHLLWGDWLELRDGVDGKYRQVRARGVDGWMHEDDLTEERLLEVNFVDIGQGDGCLVVTPEDRFLVIDAGERDNMYRFLRWRFRFDQPVDFEAFLVTHPDKDHYYGFKRLLEDENVRVGTLYHNGIVERKAEFELGPVKEFGGVEYLDDVLHSEQRLDALLAAEDANKSRKLYSTLLRTAKAGGRVGRIRPLSSNDDYLPGYTKSKDLRLRVLGPVPEKCPDGRWRLRRLGDNGVTKNGHSIVLRLEYHDVSVLLGGDLNIPAENYLLGLYGKGEPEGAGEDELAKIIETARETFEVDVAKACHHGSADFSSVFLRAVNPIATVISSGDEESHSHPRPEALGSFGLHGRGERPLIFSTELARSSRETIKNPHRLRGEIDELNEKIRSATTKTSRERAEKKLDKLLNEKLQRSVAVYGMITLRTDGKRVVLAQKLEQARSNKSKWDIYPLEPDEQGRLAYHSKHH